MGYIPLKTIKKEIKFLNSGLNVNFLLKWYLAIALIDKFLFFEYIII